MISAMKDPRKMMSISDVHFYFMVSPLVKTLRKLSTMHLAIHGPQIQTSRGKRWGGYAASIRYRYDALLYTYACERATDANGERIHPSPGPAITGKIANNGLRPFHGRTIEMWVMQPKEQKFVYIRKEAVR